MQTLQTHSCRSARARGSRPTGRMSPASADAGTDAEARKVQRRAAANCHTRGRGGLGARSVAGRSKRQTGWEIGRESCAGHLSGSRPLNDLRKNKTKYRFWPDCDASAFARHHMSALRAGRNASGRRSSRGMPVNSDTSARCSTGTAFHCETVDCRSPRLSAKRFCAPLFALKNPTSFSMRGNFSRIEISVK